MDIKNIVIAAFVGSLFTLAVQFIINRKQRNQIKDSIDLFLKDIILPTGEKIINEISIVEGAISNYSFNNISLNMHPSFNSSILDSFPIEDLQPIYKDKLIYVISIKSRLKNLENRLPYQYFKNCVSEVEQHIENHFEEHKNHFKAKTDHFHNCDEVKKLINRTSDNLSNVKDIITSINKDIIKLYE